ncbi:hypothetical protein [Rhodopila sp.]|uniref:hypothetical protein n=1 Tax=Rhodopila sp. TaxID=2480087 RepID=UPI002D7E2FAC|nr:hypothetical protein [Rhodopila sp.]
MVHRPILGPFDDVDLLSLGELDRVLQVSLLNLMKDDVDRLSVGLTEGPMGGWHFTRSPDHRSLILSHTGRVLVARTPGEDMDLVQAEIDSTACFLPVTTADFHALREIVASRWLVQSDEPPTRSQAELLPGFLLRIGGLTVDLRWNMPLDLAEFPHRLTLLRDGWRIDRVFRYRPLVVYTAFGDPHVMAELSISLQSLTGPSGYDGDVAVLTDFATEQMQALRPRDMKGHLVIIRCEAADAAARDAARLAVTGWPDAFSFQPVLSVDTAVMFDRPLGPVLESLAMGDRIIAPGMGEAALEWAEAYGGSLLLDDAWDPADLNGFSASVLGIPNLGRHAPTLELIGRIVRNRACLFGRNALSAPVQAVANYVSFRQAQFDTDTLTGVLRRADGVVEDEDACGMVHFGDMPPGEDRLAAMRSYLCVLGGILPGDVVPLDDVTAYSKNPVLDFETIMQSLQR